MPVAVLTSELMTRSRIAAAAERLEIPTEFASSADALVNLVRERSTELIILDLEQPGLQPAELVSTLRATRANGLQVVAFGPHVHEARLQAATAAGCNRVLARGKFYAELDAILQSGKVAAPTREEP
jgi:CheY-like chemotaxis protein